MRLKFKDRELIVEKGNIINQPEINAVVNAANAELKPGGGVAGAIHNAAGEDLYNACKALSPIAPGEAVITPGFNLPNEYVVHCLGPVYGKDEPSVFLLANCYKNCLRLCEEHKISSVAFPALSTGIFGYPAREAVEVVFKTVLGELARLKHLKTIKFVLFSDKDLHLYQEKLKEYTANN